MFFYKENIFLVYLFDHVEGPYILLQPKQLKLTKTTNNQQKNTDLLTY